MNNFGQRLLSARKMAGFSLQDLADKMDNSVSKQALNQYEKGMIKPLGSVVISLSRALNLPVDYFYKQSSVKLKNLEFRKKADMPVKDIESVKYKTLNYLENYIELESLFNINEIFSNPVKKQVIKNNNDIEKCAFELRKIWNFGNDPIPCVIELLEEKNVKVFEITAPEEFSEMSSITGGVAVIVVNNNEAINIVRKRFTAIHELAHLILSFHSSLTEKEKETFCYSFASAFLFPKDVFIKEIGSHRSSILLEELILLENYYGLSVQAIMRRAHTLNLISDSKFKTYNTWLNQSGNKVKMLGKFQGNEAPQRFRRLVYKALSESIITDSKAAALLNKSLVDIEEGLVWII